MNSTIKWKAVFIVLVVLLCFFGLVGLPEFPTSLAQARDNFSKRIKLGLDLQGGTHLILQVQVNEAVSLQTDQTIDHLSTLLRDKNIRYDDLRKVGDTQILVHNVAPDSTATFRDLVSSNFPDWDLAPAPGEQSGYLLSIKPSTVAGIQSETMSQTIETIRRRIDALGLTEPVVAPYGQGDNEIIVELPGEGDPNRAKSVIQAGGQLELLRVEDANPYPSEAAAQGAHGGVLPPATQLLPSKDTDASGQGSWYLVDRAPIITGRDLRSAIGGAEHGQSRRLRSKFHAVDGSGAPVWSFYRTKRRPSDGDRFGWQGGVSPCYSEPHRRFRTDYRPVWAARSKRLSLGTARRSASRRRSAIWRSARWGRLWERTRSGMECEPRLSACWWC